MKCVVARSTATGAIKSENVVGESMPDPFFDTYTREAVECGDMIELMAKTNAEFVTVIIKKSFLKSLVHSHLLHIRKLQQA